LLVNYFALAAYLSASYAIYVASSEILFAFIVISAAFKAFINISY